MGQCRKLYFVIVPYYIAKCEYTNRLDKKKYTVPWKSVQVPFCIEMSRNLRNFFFEQK